MIEEKIVVSDTNIFLDLLSIDLLDAFFRLPCKIATTDFVMSEIQHPEQLEKVNVFVHSSKLEIAKFDFSEVAEINAIFENNDNNASIPDCSVWYYAKKTNGRLLTGDAKLKKSATKDSLKVSGILYIFDNLVEYEIADKKLCAQKLVDLLQINTRLPKGECEKRIEEWGKS